MTPRTTTGLHPHAGVSLAPAPCSAPDFRLLPAPSRDAKAVLLRAHRDWRMLRACNAALLRAGTETELLDQVCKIIVEAGGYRMAWVGAIAIGAKTPVCPLAHAGGATGDLALWKRLWVAPLRQHAPTLIASRTGKPSVCAAVQQEAKFGALRRHALKHGYAACAALPLISDHRCWGALTVYAVEPGAFSRAELTLLTQLAENLAFGVQVWRTRSARQRLEEQILQISEREQRRIGQDLHDGLGQQLAAIAYRVAALQSQWDAPVRSEPSALEDIGTLLRGAMLEAHTLARGLHPVKLGADGWLLALRELADNITQSFKVTCSFGCERPMLVADNQAATNLYRIAQEAARNAAVHAGAKHIWIRLVQRRSEIVLSITDDGQGLPEPLPPGKGLGLEIMKYRARTIGATLEIKGGKHTGTSIRCSMKPPGPLDNPQEPDRVFRQI